MNKILLIACSAMLLGAGCAPTYHEPVKPSPAPEQTTTAPAANVYETANLKVTIPKGWNASGVTPTAVNITKDNWILYINMNASQASGNEGGRFAEIGMGAPSVDAVVTDEPSECGKTQSHAAFGKFTRVDYTVSAADKQEWCATPTNGHTVWFFSYLTSPGNGFFNHYTVGQSPGLVVTMAYNTKTVNDLPAADSTELSVALQQMTDIASTLVVKGK